MRIEDERPTSTKSAKVQVNSVSPAEAKADAKNGVDLMIKAKLMKPRSSLPAIEAGVSPTKR